MTMDMLQEIFFTCVLPLIGILCAYGIAFLRKYGEQIKEQTDNELFDKYMDMLISTIETCVIATNQTYVDELKKQGKFGPEEHDIAYHKTLDAVKAILSTEAQKYLAEIYGDIDFYISQLIQEAVRVNKKKKQKNKG